MFSAESETRPSPGASQHRTHDAQVARGRPFAWRLGRMIGDDEFRSQVASLAETLPENSHVINLCEDRYAFAAGLAAAMMRGQTVLLPPDRSAWMLESLARQYPSLYCLVEPAQAPPAMNSAVLDVDRPLTASTHRILDIPDERIVAIPFTSGSTGQPQPHPKTWGHFRESARLIAGALGLEPGTAIVATVPAQHMYGLELSVLLPLCCGAVLDASRPFFPLDVRHSLAAIDAPRMLVTTPVHIRALLAAGIELPPLAAMVSATAPLTGALAIEAEARFHAPLIEIYGCTEAGSIASRRPALEELWTWFDGVSVRQEEGLSIAEAAYLPGPMPLNDVIETRGERRFRLHGRLADLINIAGKRTSLGALNHILNGVDGVSDGAFFLPDEAGGHTARLIAFVAAPEMETGAILEQLRQRLDPVFMPRALYRVDALPRAATGKLPRAALKALAARLQASDRLAGVFEE
jgi:acyl-coenzyme A synthetase/AMP-(fatty) acid ligase